MTTPSEESEAAFQLI